MATSSATSVIHFLVCCAVIAFRVSFQRAKVKVVVCEAAVDVPCQGPFHFLTLLIITMTCVLSLTQLLVFLSMYVMLIKFISILVYAAASLFCACLTSVQVSAPYVIAGSMQELYTNFFGQMAMLLLKISQCLAYAAQPPMILRFISSSWCFSLRL